MEELLNAGAAALEGADEETVEETGRDAGAQDDVVRISSLDGQAETGQETGEAREDAPADGDAGHEPRYDQQAINKAIAARLHAERRKHQSDPVYRVGQMLVEQYDGLPREEAAARAMGDLMQAKAAQLSQDPLAMAREIAMQRYLPRAEPVDEITQTAERMLDEVTTLQAEGHIPKDFNLAQRLKSSPAFAADCRDYGVKAALRMAELGAPAQPKLPASMRPTGSAQTKGLDIAGMSDEQFATLRARIHRASAQGRTVKLD